MRSLALRAGANLLFINQLKFYENENKFKQ